MAKTSALVFRVTDEEKAALKSLAEAAGVSVSDLLRRMARESISHGPDFFIEDRNLIIGMTRMLSSLGRNINQIARKVNSGQCKMDPLSEKKLGEISAAVQATRLTLKKTVENAKKRRVILRAAGRGKNRER